MESITLTTILTVVGLFMTSVSVPLGWLFIKLNNLSKALEKANSRVEKEINERKLYESQFKEVIEKDVENKLVAFRAEYEKDVKELKKDFGHVIKNVQDLNTQITTRIDGLILSLMEKKG